MRALTGRAGVAAIVIVALVAGVLIGRLSGGLGGGGSLASVAEARGMTVAEAEGALKAFTPPGKYDEYVLFSSGGHSGNIHLVGVPWLAVTTGETIGEAIAGGLAPFLVADVVKLLAAAAVFPFAWWVVGRRPSER